MFDAVIAGKAKMARILDGAERSPREDLVTSSLFGTLRFLTPAARIAALTNLSGHSFEDDAVIHLWPYFKGHPKDAEPDVVLETTIAGEPALWIVEVKWGASLGDDQAAREIVNTRSGDCKRGQVKLPTPRQVYGYTLLGAERKHDAEMEKLENRKEVGSVTKIHRLTWKEVAARLLVLSRRPDIDAGLKAWAAVAAHFLLSQPHGRTLELWPKLKMPTEFEYNFRAEGKPNGSESTAMSDGIALSPTPFVPAFNYEYREHK